MLEITLRRTILRAAEPILPAIGKVQVPTWLAPRLMGKDDAASFMALDPLPGTVLLSRKRLQLSNVVNVGTWKHVAMFVGEFHAVPLIIEAVWPWVRLVPVERWFEGEDYAKAVIPTFADAHLMDVAADLSVALTGLKYDRMFEYAKQLTANRAFYCAEVPWWTYDKAFEAIGKPCPFEVRKTLGLETVAPDDYHLATDKWKTIWTSKTAAALGPV